MAEKNLPVNEAIEILYQAPNAESGLDIRADIYDQNKALKFGDILLVEVLNTGTYRESFTPDAQGEWEAIIYKFVDSNTRDGQVTKRYSVGAHNVHSVGEGVAALPDADAVNVEVDSALADYDAPTKAELDSAHATTDAKIDNLDTKVSSLDTPPMVS